MSGDNDELDIYLEIHAGAGGTESQDWADMLRRMYIKWFDKKNLNMKSLVSTREKKLESSTIKGRKLFVWSNENESGVHRLVQFHHMIAGLETHKFCKRLGVPSS